MVVDGVYLINTALFTECNLNCEFCYQRGHKEEFNASDMEFILSLPDRIESIMKDERIQFRDGKRCFQIGFSGGELFSKRVLYPLYRYICQEIAKRAKNNGCELSKFFFMSNGVFFNIDEVEKLLEEANGVMEISYDFYGRFRDGNEKISIKNLKTLYRDGFSSSITTTITKPSIKAFIEDYNGLFPDDIFREIDINSSYYLPSVHLNNKKFMPTDDDIYDFLKTCYINGYTNLDILKSLMSTDGENYKTYCQEGVVLYKGISKESYLTDSCGDMALMSSLSGGTEELFGNIGSIREAKRKAYDKRGCIYCEYMNTCPMPCWTMMAYKNYMSSDCPFKRMKEFIKENPYV